MTIRRRHQRGREIIGFASACLATIVCANVARGQTGTVLSHQKISETEGGLTDMLEDLDGFGWALADLGDLDGEGDSVIALAVGVPYNLDGVGGGGPDNEGAVWILFMNADGTVHGSQQISDTAGGFGGVLDAGDKFGSSVVALGDLDGGGDSVIALAVGANGDSDGAMQAGAVWILFLNNDGTVHHEQKISATDGGFIGPLALQDRFGNSLTALGDLDGGGDSVMALAVGAHNADDGFPGAGEVWILFLNDNGTVHHEQKISATAGGLMGPLAPNVTFGQGLAALGDLEGGGDSVVALAVGATLINDGATAAGAVFILFLNEDGTVHHEQKISATDGGFMGPLDEADKFGAALATLPDVNDDSVVALAIGARNDDDGGPNRGAVWILFLNDDGTVNGHQKISATEGGFAGPLNDHDAFGRGLATLGDGGGTLAVGAAFSDGGGNNRGAVWILFLDVAVADPEAQLDEVAEDLLEIINDDPGAPLADKLEDALASLETALDELNKEPSDNQAVVGNLEGAVGSICDAILDDGLDAVQGTQLMDALAGVAMQLAVDAIDEAIAVGGDAGEIQEAMDFLAAADSLRELAAAGMCELFKVAIGAYKDALAKAEGALP